MNDTLSASTDFLLPRNRFSTKAGGYSKPRPDGVRPAHRLIIVAFPMTGTSQLVAVATSKNSWVLVNRGSKFTKIHPEKNARQSNQTNSSKFPYF
jgi:hypothetical protein